MDDSNAIATRYGQTMATWVTPDVGRRTTKTAMQLGWSTSKLIKWALERSLPAAEKMADAHRQAEED